MADVSYIVHSKGQGELVTQLKKYVIVQATVSKDDTITIAELANIEGVSIYSLTDSHSIARTLDTNVITITEDPCSGEKIIILALGT